MNIDFPIYDLPASTVSLRSEVRQFIAEEKAAGRWQRQGDFGTAHDPEFSKRLASRGWVGMTWPKAYGGQEASMLDRLAVTEELIAANAPVAAHWIADRQSGPLLLRFGTEEQRQAFLPQISRGECFFSIGMSEPDSGSDLASVRTKAVPVDGGWQVSGRKVWTSFAHVNHFAIVLVRTGEAGESRHEGLSQLIIDLSAPGVEVNPIINMAGTHEFNEVVFDDVFVPADRMVGEPGNGWGQVTSELAYERSGPERYLSCIRLVEAIVSASRDQASDEIKSAVGRLASRLIALRAMSISVATSLQNGGMPNLEAALIKDLGNSFEQDQVEILRSLMGDVKAPTDELRAALTEASLYSATWSLRGGTREILRGIIARGLGLR